MCIFKMSNLSKYQRLACLIFFSGPDQGPQDGWYCIEPTCQAQHQTESLQ